ncbi:hypothetical protein GN956_G19181 [Arapaima gigas]
MLISGPQCIRRNVYFYSVKNVLAVQPLQDRGGVSSGDLRETMFWSIKAETTSRPLIRINRQGQSVLCGQIFLFNLNTQIWCTNHNRLNILRSEFFAGTRMWKQVGGLS